MKNASLSAWAAEEVKTHFAMREVTEPQYASMKYPRFIPLMRFLCRQYEVTGFGNLFTMDTAGPAGLMKLTTLVFTPGSGAGVPFLLIDTMETKKKSLAYVEYYDLTARGASLPGCEGQREEFAHLPDYPEKPAWYVERRTPWSLIKGGDGVSPEALAGMVRTCLTRYLDAAGSAERDPENLKGLRAFRQDMLTLGNPSSATLEKVLGKEGAERMFREAIMPCETDLRK